MAWPRGAREVELERIGPTAKVVHTDVVDVLPELDGTTIDAGPWRAAPVPGGMRFAIVVPPNATVIADLTWGESMHLRVVRDFVGFNRDPWFDILVQLLVSELAPTCGGLALHAACVAVSGKAVLLCGQSGAGKSTISGRLIRAGARPVSHDRTMVFGDGTWRAVSTPWGHDGMLAGAQDERERELSAVLFLEQATENASERLAGARAVTRLASVLLGARSSIAVMNEAMRVAEHLVREVPCHVVRLTNDDRAAAHVLELV